MWQTVSVHFVIRDLAKFKACIRPCKSYVGLERVQLASNTRGSKGAGTAGDASPLQVWCLNPNAQHKYLPCYHLGVHMLLQQKSGPSCCCATPAWRVPHEA